MKRDYSAKIEQLKLSPLRKVLDEFLVNFFNFFPCLFNESFIF